MLQLTIELIDSAVELTFLRGGFSLDTNRWEEFQPAWVLVFSMFWVVFKLTLGLFTKNSGRIIGLIHAICMVTIGAPVLWLLVEKSFSYTSMFESFVSNVTAISITCNLMCYTSVGYFMMDSYFLVKRAYLKHHIGAMAAWILAAYHHETSIVHGAVVIALFETGAILVQLSRMLSDYLFIRFIICLGYTSTRLSLAWYYGFIMYTSYQFFTSDPFVLQIFYPPIYASLFFLLALNAKWSFLQWKALYKITFGDKPNMDFYSYHQKIIGNTD